jgi:hypothetical protein
VCELRGHCHAWTAEEREACQVDCRETFELGFGDCVRRAIEAASCEDADACFGELNQPPEGYCGAACDFEATLCELITPEEVEGCFDLCTAGGQTDDFYACRQAAIDAGDCDGYLNCAE